MKVSDTILRKSEILSLNDSSHQVEGLLSGICPDLESQGNGLFQAAFLQICR